MSFNLILYQNLSEKNKIDKDIQFPLTITGTLKNESSIINPVIVASLSANAASSYNYIYIESFNRYYYINDAISIRNGITELHCKVDVLMSFRTEILNNTAIIERSETEWNLYLNDGSFKTYANNIVLTKAFPSGFTTMNFVLAVASP